MLFASVEFCLSEVLSQSPNTCLGWSCFVAIIGAVILVADALVFVWICFHKTSHFKHVYYLNIFLLFYGGGGVEGGYLQLLVVSSTSN